MRSSTAGFEAAENRCRLAHPFNRDVRVDIAAAEKHGRAARAILRSRAAYPAGRSARRSIPRPQRSDRHGGRRIQATGRRPARNRARRRDSPARRRDRGPRPARRGRAALTRSPGSFCSIGARNEYGYQVWPAACGAIQAMSEIPSSSPSVSISLAEPPRPCTRMTARRAADGAGPRQRGFLRCVGVGDHDRDSGFGARGSGSETSGLGIRGSGLGFRNVGTRDSGLGARVHKVGTRDSGTRDWSGSSSSEVYRRSRQLTSAGRVASSAARAARARAARCRRA